MKALAPLVSLLIGPAPIDHPRPYLLSIVDLPLKTGESIAGFAIDTWGVRGRAVCHIPDGRRIEAGGSVTLEGIIAGRGSRGATWFHHRNPRELDALLLVTLDAPVRHRMIGTPDNGVPATFSGTATLDTDDGDALRRLTYRNIRLTPARRCPTR